MRYLVGFLISLSNLFFAISNDNLTTAISQVNADVVFMRHALAPGFSSPSKFQLESAQSCAIWIVWDGSRLWQLGQNLGAVKPSSQRFFQASGVDAKKRLNFLICRDGRNFQD